MEAEFRYDLVGEQTNKKREQTIRPKSCSVLTDSYIVVGMVATGYDWQTDVLLEISAIRYENNRKVEQYSELVRPEMYYLVSPEEAEKREDYCIIDGGPVYYIEKRMSKSTGITNQMLSQAREQKEVLKTFRAFVEDAVLLGQDSTNQIAFINHLLESDQMEPLENEYIDCKNLVMRTGKGIGALSLNELAIQYELPYTGVTRAGQVAELIHQVYQAITKKMVVTERVTRPLPVNCSIEDKVCVFTGTLQNMVRGKAMQLVRAAGGMTGTSVTKKTDYLILGSKEYQARLRGEKSTKLRRAERLIEEGQPLIILSEEEFYQMVGYQRSL